MAIITDEPRVEAGVPPPKRRSRLLRALALLVVGAVIGATVVLFASSLSTSTPSVKTVADRWATAMGQNDLPNRIVDLYADNATWHDAADGTNLIGVNGVKEGWSVFVLPGFKIDTVTVEAAGAGGAAVSYTMSGTRSPFSGKPWTVPAVSVLQISNGKITSETIYYNLDPLK